MPDRSTRQSVAVEPGQAALPERLARSSEEAGVGTLWAVSWIFICLTMGWLGVLASGVVARQHHLDGAADLVSISAAGRLQRGEDPCQTAAEIARANDVRLTVCSIDGEDVVVSVSDEVILPFGLAGHLRSGARAGP